jgi:hypothetical protein
MSQLAMEPCLQLVPIAQFTRHPCLDEVVNDVPPKPSSLYIWPAQREVGKGSLRRERGAPGLFLQEESVGQVADGSVPAGQHEELQELGVFVVDAQGIPGGL